jgi:hypothetical protein
MPGVADPGAVIVKHTRRNTSVAVSRSFFDTLGDDGIWMNGQFYVFTVIYPLKRRKK